LHEWKSKTFRVLLWMMKMTDVQTLTDDEIDSQLPVPVGYKLLIALPTVEDTYDSGLIKAENTKHAEQVLSIIGLVLDMGEQAYSDPNRFPNGPWCEIGQYVMFRANTGTRFRFNGTEYRLMNDDSIEAVVSDPQGITRA
jgi:co-chaperonin GroES (HSP10)